VSALRQSWQRDRSAVGSPPRQHTGGLWQPTSGQIIWEGRPVLLRSPKDAETLGITTIYQDLALCDSLDIAQNMFLGHEPAHHLVLDEDTMEIAARKTLEELSVTSVRSVRQPVGSLSGGQRQSVAVARAVMAHAKLVIMDEPTAALGVSQTQMVLDLIRRLADHGVGVIMISHNLNDVFSVADRVAVLHLGRLVASGPLAEFDRQSIVEYMTTGRLERPATPAAAAAASRLWRVSAADQGGGGDVQ
jgi:ABC-type sugar transport system ATPase subunit